MTGLPLAVVLLATVNGAAERGTIRPLNQQGSQDFQLVEQWRVGSDALSMDRGFGRVSALAVGPDQSVWVTDSHGPRLIRISAHGREMDEIGRVGSGPGEFDGNILVATYTHGRMALRDTGNGRINIYRGDGSYQKTITGIGGGLQSVEQTFQTGPNGEIFLRANDYTVPPPPQGRRPTRWLVHDSTGSLLRTLSPPAPGRNSSVYVLVTGSGPREPFPVRPVNYMGPDGRLVWGHTNEYTVVSHDGKHPTQVIEKRRWTSPVTTRAERRMWQDITRYFETRGYTNDTPIPDRKPAFRYLRVDLDGRIFVARYVAAQKADVSPEDDEDGWKPMEWVEPESFDVFSSGGTYLGALSLPIGERFAQARGDALWTIGRGEYDVPFVAEYRLTR